MKQQTVAVFFGGRSPEHDVSIITALQAINALDSTKYTVIPIYIHPTGKWLTGKQLLEQSNYMLDAATLKQLSQITLDLSYCQGKGRLLQTTNKLFGKSKAVEFDVALLAMHGLHGEDGNIPAIMEMANIPYTGMRHMASVALMDKVLTKQVLQSQQIPMLAYRVLHRPEEGLLIDEEEIARIITGLEFPCCIKPCHLGSSIGVAKVTNVAEISATLPNIFKYDDMAIIEPYVDNLVEYNVSLGYIDGKLLTSAIEQPKCSTDLLDFKQKYAAGGKGAKTSLAGMLAMTRDINPDIPQAAKIRELSIRAFEHVQGSGFPRIDFLCNKVTGELWLNEINPCPGSFVYYLWEAIEQPVLFTQLLDHLITESFTLHSRNQLPLDPTPIEARLFSRKS